MMMAMMMAMMLAMMMAMMMAMMLAMTMTAYTQNTYGTNTYTIYLGIRSVGKYSGYHHHHHHHHHHLQISERVNAVIILGGVG